jgi:hypothetical protein
MKTKSTFITALLIFGAVMSSVASDGLAVIPVKGTDTYKVVYKGEAKVKLNIYNNDAQLIHSENVNQNGFILPLNLSKLAAGKYTVELVGANGKMVETINHKIVTPAINYIHISKLIKEDGKFLVSVTNEQKVLKEINVKIYGRDGLLYNETKSASGDFAQVYAVKVPGELTFEISDANGNVKTVRF